MAVQDTSSGKQAGRKCHSEVLDRALDVLDLLRATKSQLRLTDIAQAVRLDLTTTFRLLHTLEDRGYVLRDERTKRYSPKLGFRTYRIGYAELSSDQPFPRKVTEGLVEAAQGGGIELLVLDNRNDPYEAVKNAARLIAARVDFAIEYQFHYRVAPLLGDMFSKAGIPTLAIDIPQPGAIYFGVDNYAAGFLGGEVLARFAQESWRGDVGQILLLEIPEAGPVPYARVLGTLRGIESVRDELSKKQVLHRNSRGTEVGGYAVTRQALAGMGSREHLLVSAANDNTARGAIRAVHEAHREKSTAILAQGWCMDATLEEEIANPSSPLIGAVAYFPEKYGSMILPIALQHLNGQPVPPAVHAEHKLIARDEILSLSSAGPSYEMHLPRGAAKRGAAQQSIPPCGQILRQVAKMRGRAL
jgi:ribose transport system substrate-binding protein